MAKKEKTKNSTFKVISEACVLNIDNTLKIAKIAQVTDLNELLFLGSNRPLNKTHVSRMYDSILSIGIVRLPVVIKTNFKLYRGDGQHLFEAMSLAGAKSFRFFLVEAETEEEAFKIIAMLNSTQKRFTTINYIDGWANYNSDYKTMQSFYKTYKLSNGVMAELLTGLPAQDALKVIKGGKLKVTDMELAKEKILFMYDLMNRTQHKMGSRGCEGIIDLFNVFGADLLIAKKEQFFKSVKKILTTLNLIDEPLKERSDYLRLFTMALQKCKE